MKIVPMDQVGRETWDAFVAASDQAWFFHSYDLITAKTAWRHHKNESFAVLDEAGRVQAVLPLHRIESFRKKILPVHVLNCLGGLAVANDVAGTRREDKIWDSCLAHVVNGIPHKHVDRIEFWLSPMAPALRGEDCPLVNPLVPRGALNMLTQTWVVDLREGEQAVHARTAKGFRESLKKAESANLEIIEAGHDRDLLDIYYALHVETCARSSLRPHPFSYFEEVWTTLLPAGQCQILFARYEGRVVSAINYALGKNAGAYWTGVSSQQALDLCANHLLHWHMLKYLMAHGYAWAEIGEAIFRSENAKHVSISDFKSRMGGHLYPYYKGALSRKELSAYAGRQ